jgi:hypothetical protein
MTSTDLFFGKYNAVRSSAVAASHAFLAWVAVIVRPAAAAAGAFGAAGMFGVAMEYQWPCRRSSLVAGGQ